MQDTQKHNPLCSCFPPCFTGQRGLWVPYHKPQRYTPDTPIPRSGRGRAGMLAAKPSRYCVRKVACSVVLTSCSSRKAFRFDKRGLPFYSDNSTQKNNTRVYNARFTCLHARDAPFLLPVRHAFCRFCRFSEHFCWKCWAYATT